MTPLVVHALLATLIFFAVLDMAIVALVGACAFVLLRFYLYTKGIDLHQWWFVLWSHAPAQKATDAKPRGQI